MGITKIALRNIFRNTRRSLLTALSLTVSGFVIVTLHGYIRGVLDAGTEMVIKLDSGHILITTEEYFKRRTFIPSEEYIENKEEIEKRLKESKLVDFYTMRIKTGGLVFAGNSNKPAMILGIDPALEEKAFNLKGKIKEGTYNLDKGCVVAIDLAKSLGIKPQDTIIILSKSAAGGLSAVKIPVSGIAYVGYSVMDRSLVVLSLENARKLLKVSEGANEVLVFLKKESWINNFLSETKLPEGIVANPYTFVLGSFAFFFKFADVFYSGIYVLITLLAAFAIVNTMTVAVFERMREIGTLKAIGMTDKEVFTMFGIEGTLIGSAGGLFGALLGLLTNAILRERGINFESMVKGIEFPFPYIVRPAVNLWIVFFAFFLVTAISFLTATIPALYAKKLTPQEALRQV